MRANAGQRVKAAIVASGGRGGPLSASQRLGTERPAPRSTSALASGGSGEPAVSESRAPPPRPRSAQHWLHVVFTTRPGDLVVPRDLQVGVVRQIEPQAAGTVGLWLLPETCKERALRGKPDSTGFRRQACDGESESRATGEDE